MNNISRRLPWIAIMLLACLFVVGLAYAQATGYSLPWWTVDGGGGTSNGEGYTLNGTIGQADQSAMSGDGYFLRGGFWLPASTPNPTPAIPPERNLYLPLLTRP
ncbi:MAG: hypothetical protein EHM70_08710 [Chloroflexota bacterium]|nr:MAG: hypothetical protein EHM70_08710 [Chloroflexota bacterium]